MSNEQVAITTAYAAIIQSIASVAQIFVALFAIGLARREVRKWRHELLGTKQIELAIRLGKAAYAVQQAIEDTRGYTLYRNAKSHEDYIVAFDKITSSIEALREIRLDASLILTSDDVKEISSQILAYEMAFMRMRQAVFLKFHPSDKAKYVSKTNGDIMLDENIVINIDDSLNSLNDLYNQKTLGHEIADITERIVEITLKYTK